LEFDGYWRERYKAGVPDDPGVYLVYVCQYDQSTERVSLKKLIYIGEAANARERIEGHDKWSDWRKYVGEGQQICFSFAPITSPDRERGEAALVYHHKPSCNDKYVDQFPFEDTTVKSSGRCALLATNVTVSKTP
jgi:hypothetical protein